MYRLEANCREFLTSTTNFNHPSFDMGVVPVSAPVPSELNSAIVLVHGFGGSHEKVTAAYVEMENKIEALNLGYDASVRFYWPGSWSKTIGFLMARRRVKEAAHRLMIYMNRLASSYKVKNICIQAHSLGCAVTHELVRHVKQTGSIFYNEQYKFVYCAPAITNSSLEKELSENRLIEYPNLTIAHSKNDPVLKYAFRLAPGNWSSSAIGFEPSSANRLWLANFKDMTSLVTTHTGYRKIDDYYELMRIS